MYVPPAFRQDDLPTLHAAIRRAGLATLVTMGAGEGAGEEPRQGPGGLIATHLPLLLDAEAGPYGTLVGHVAKPNPHWRAAAGAAPSLAIFQGPDAYVSPSWYPSKQATGKAVPTWNYVAVHAYGPLEIFDRPDELLEVVRRLSDRFEDGRAPPWRVEDAPAGYIDAMLKGIVGIRLPIERLEGKWKLSQNRSADDRDGVARGLTDEGTAAADAVAALMRD